MSEPPGLHLSCAISFIFPKMFRKDEKIQVAHERGERNSHHHMNGVFVVRSTSLRRRLEKIRLGRTTQLVPRTSWSMEGGAVCTSPRPEPPVQNGALPRLTPVQGSPSLLTR